MWCVNFTLLLTIFLPLIALIFPISRLLFISDSTSTLLIDRPLILARPSSHAATLPSPHIASSDSALFDFARLASPTLISHPPHRRRRSCPRLRPPLAPPHHSVLFPTRRTARSLRPPTAVVIGHCCFVLCLPRSCHRRPLHLRPRLFAQLLCKRPPTTTAAWPVPTLPPLFVLASLLPPLPHSPRVPAVLRSVRPDGLNLTQPFGAAP